MGVDGAVGRLVLAMSAAAIPFNSETAWPEPDPRLLGGGLRPAPPFPSSALGPLASYVRDLAAAKDGPPDYLALSLLTTAAGVIGDARAVQLRANWIEPCVLWGLLVGNPSTGKTQPLDLMKRATRAIEPDDAPDFADHHRAWQSAAAMAKEVEARWLADVKKALKNSWPSPARPAEADAPPEPLPPRILIGNATVEKLGRLFEAFPRGLLLIVDEGAAWLGNFGKYGGDGDAAFYLSAFNGIGTTVDRVKEGGSVAPARALLSACVCIPPERLSELLLKGRADDGLVSRFLPVWPDPIGAVWDTPYVDERRVDTILRRLRTLRPATDGEGRPTPSVLPLSSEAADVFSVWWVEAKGNAQAASGLMAGFLGKGLGVAGRLALIIELLAWAWSDGREPEAVSVTSVTAAIELFDAYFVPMAARVYGDASRPAAERAAVAVVKEIRKRKVATVNAREVRRSWGLPGLAEAADVDAALGLLEEGDCVRAIGTSSAKGGRRRSDYAVNPRLFGSV